MIRKIQNILNKNKTILANFGYLGALQIVSMLIPLATYPYLIRVLEKETYGLIVFAQAIVSYFVVIVNFGFNISATKDVSIHRNNKAKLNEIVSSVLIIKGILFLSALLILVISIYTIPQLREHKILLLLCMWMCLYEFIFPMWYFQGIEKMKYITFLTLASRLTFLVFIFVFIKSKGHYLRVPMINGFGSILAGTISLYIVFVRHELKFVKVPIKNLKKYFNEGFVLFLSNAIMTFKDKTNILLIGSFIGTGAVAEFDLAIKIKDLLFVPINLLNQAIYPKISKEKNMKFMISVLKISFIAMTSVTLILFPFIDNIVLLLGGGDLIEAAELTRIILFSVPVIVISFTIATNCINALGYYKLRFKSMLLTTLFYFLLVMLGILFGWKEEIRFYAYVIIIGYVIELLYRLYLVNKYQMLR